jgi:hypothetical protein
VCSLDFPGTRNSPPAARHPRIPDFRRIPLDWRIDELLHTGKVHDLVKLPVDLARGS